MCKMTMELISSIVEPSVPVSHSSSVKQHIFLIQIFL